MEMILLLLAQAVTQPDAGLSPDIILDARAQIREVRIEQRGQTSLTVRGGPGSDVRIEKPATQGATRLRNVDVAVRAEAMIAEPQEVESRSANGQAQENPEAPETASPE
jgi:hypothetical protein